MREPSTTAETHSQLAGFIWSICNLLRGPYKRSGQDKVDFRRWIRSKDNDALDVELILYSIDDNHLVVTCENRWVRFVNEAGFGHRIRHINSDSPGWPGR